MDSLRGHINAMIEKSFHFSPESILAFLLSNRGTATPLSTFERADILAEFSELLQEIKNRKFGLSFSGSDSDVLDHAVRGI